MPSALPGALAGSIRTGPVTGGDGDASILAVAVVCSTTGDGNFRSGIVGSARSFLLIFGGSRSGAAGLRFSAENKAPPAGGKFRRPWGPNPYTGAQPTARA